MKIQCKHKDILQYCLILCLIGVVVYTFILMPKNPIDIIKLPEFINICVATALILIAFETLEGNTKFRIEIIENTNPSIKRDIHSETTKTALFSTISSILAVPFVIMILVFTYSASNPEHTVLIIFNDYGEWLLEVIVFTITGAIVIIGAVMNVRNLKGMKD